MIKSPGNEIKLIDYDIAQNVDTNKSKFFVGTHGYLSPEQVKKKPYALEKNQVWQLGVVLYNIYYVQDRTRNYHFLNFKGYIDNTRQRDRAIDDQLNSQRNYSPEIVKFLDMALSLDPRKRPTLAEVSLYFKNL
jgi:serine/threonine protein kinase